MKSRKLLAVTLAFILMLSFTATAFANNSADLSVVSDPPDYAWIRNQNGDPVVPFPKNKNGATYVADEFSTSARSINVSFVIEAGNRNVSGGGTGFRVEIPEIQVQTIGGYVTVSQVIDAVNKLSAVYGLTFYGSGGAAFTTTTSYLDAVKYGATTWQAGQVSDYINGQYGFDGWAYRLNDLFPVVPLDGYGDPWYEGTQINKVYVSPGDVVHLFYDLPADYSIYSGPNFAANYIRALPTNVSGSSITVQLQGHKTNIDSNFWMYVYDYVPLGSGNVATLWSVSGSSWTLVGTGTTDSFGNITFTGSFTSGATYFFKTASTFKSGYSGLGVPIFGNAFFERTGAFSKIIMP